MQDYDDTSERMQFDLECELQIAVKAWHRPTLLHKDTSMKASEFGNSKFLKKEDFPQPKVLTIKSASAEEVAKGDVKLCIYFNEIVKPLTLNNTKRNLLIATFGDDTDQWIGKKVRLSLDPTVMYAGQPVGGIRLECSKSAAPVKPVAPAPIVNDDDDVPF
jgi:hypothetical protein